MEFALPTAIFFGLAILGVLLLFVEIVCLALLLRTRRPDPPRWPSVSIIKPLCGLDDELLENLESHLALDYPAPFEILLGVRSEKDPAFSVAQAFAKAHPDRVRLLLQRGEPGHNPKVNQLITLTAEAKYEVIALTDSNVRVHPGYLREHAQALADPKIGLSTNVISGVGERRLGAILDNLTLASFVAPNIASSSVALRIDEVVGKSIVIPRTVLEKVGGWHSVKDVLAEDHALGLAVRRAGLRTSLCPSAVFNVQRDVKLAYFWGRHTRWAMIRYRILIPGVYLEPIINVFTMCLFGALLSPTRLDAWWFCLGGAIFSIAYTQLGARLARGYGFSLKHLALVPLRDLLLFFAWARGGTLREVNWRGNRLLVLARTRLADPEAYRRTRRLKLGK